MPRLTAARRLDIMSAALALAEDHAATSDGSIALAEIAEQIGEDVEDVRESLEPLHWVEMKTPEGIVDLLDAIELVEDELRVGQAWWRRLAVLSPAEAARLYVRAAAAASLDSPHSPYLKSAMAKLRRIVGGVTVLEGDVPPTVVDLRRARDSGTEVLVNIEGHDRTVVTSRARFVVVAVYRAGSDWMVTLESVGGNRDLSMTEGDVVTLPVERILGVISAAVKDESTDPTPAVIDPAPQVEVRIEYPIEKEWVLDPLSPLDIVHCGDDRREATVEVWGVPELKTVMLRLGPESRIVQPPELADIKKVAASEILELYD